jgi:hypothetical protein
MEIGRPVDRYGKRHTCGQRWKAADLWTDMEIGRRVDRDDEEADLWTEMERGRLVNRDGERQTCGQR